MKPVDQEWLKGNAGGIPGDCVRACVATILEVDRSAVPHFVHEHGGMWGSHLEDWCEAVGIELVHLDGARCFEFPVMWCGESPREGRHAVVSLRGQIVHDPHPSRAGLAALADRTFLFLPVHMHWPSYLAEHGGWAGFGAEST